MWSRGVRRVGDYGRDWSIRRKLNQCRSSKHPMYRPSRCATCTNTCTNVSRPQINTTPQAAKRQPAGCKVNPSPKRAVRNV